MHSRVDEDKRHVFAGGSGSTSGGIVRQGAGDGRGGTNVSGDGVCRRDEEFQGIGTRAPSTSETQQLTAKRNDNTYPTDIVPRVHSFKELHKALSMSLASSPMTAMFVILDLVTGKPYSRWFWPPFPYPCPGRLIGRTFFRRTAEAEAISLARATC